MHVVSTVPYASFSVSMYTNVFIKMINPFRCAYDNNLALLCLQWCMKSECVPSDIPIDVSGKEFVLFRFLTKMSKLLKFQISSKRIKDKTFILIQSKCPHVIVCILYWSIQCSSFQTSATPLSNVNTYVNTLKSPDNPLAVGRRNVTRFKPFRIKI